MPGEDCWRPYTHALQLRVSAYVSQFDSFKAQLWELL